jgi:molybdate transport system ATP-binding protein
VSAGPWQLAVRHPSGSFVLEVEWQGRCAILGISGPSGSGKTTLLEVIAGLRRPAAARVVVGDRILIDTATGVDVPVGRRGTGYVPQDVLLFPHLSVRANVLYGAPRGPGAPLTDVLAMLEIEALEDRGVAGLSGGERQRVALARALLSSPSHLLLDEPLGAVDVPRRRRILQRLAAWIAARTLPTVHVSHDAAELSACDHVLVLADGRLVADGSPDDVLR